MAIVVSSVLAMSLLSFSNSVHTSASSQTVSKNYLIAYSNSLPKNYQTEIKNEKSIVNPDYIKLVVPLLYTSCCKSIKSLSSNKYTVEANSIAVSDMAYCTCS